MRVLERFRKFDVPRGKLSSQCIRIRNIKVGIPSGRRLSLPIGERSYANTLEHDHGSTAAHDAKERLMSGLLKSNLKAEPLSIKGKRCRSIPHDEEWRY